MSQACENMMSSAVLEPRILVVEDHFLQARNLADLVRDLGFVVVGPVGALHDACHLAQTETLHGAILDVDICGGDSMPVAEILRQRGCPYIFVTARAEHEALFASRHPQAPRLAKPLNHASLCELALTTFKAAATF